MKQLNQFEREKLIKGMKEFGRKVTPEQALDLLVKAGIATEEGKLKEPYK